MKLKKKLFIIIISMLIIIFCRRNEVSATTAKTNCSYRNNQYSIGMYTEQIRNGTNGRSKYTRTGFYISDFKAKDMAGFEVQLEYGNASRGESLVEMPIEVECLTEGWSVSEWNNDGEICTFVVEPEDNYIVNKNAPQEVDIEITLPVSENFHTAYDPEKTIQQMTSRGVNILATRVTNYDNSVTDLHTSSNSELYNDIVEIYDLLEVKNEYKDDVRVDVTNDEIYVKLNGHNNSQDQTLLEDFYNAFEDISTLDDNIMKFSDGTSSAIGGGAIDKPIATGDIWAVSYNSDAPGQIDYKIFLIGDLRTTSNRGIDIDDISYLRKAIVNKDDVINQSDFCIKTTDVNDSNVLTNGERALGDIGDVIAIRRRILNKVWDETIPTVTTAPTNAVSQKTKYQDISSDNKIAVIPRGFRVSGETDEQKIDDGLVVIAPDGSEFVWVPVEDVSTMYGTDAEGNKLGKLYEFTDANPDNNTARNWKETGGTMNWTASSGSGSNREPELLSSYDTDSQYYKEILGYNSSTEFETAMENEFDAMLDSVEKNGGFYVGRYETSLNSSGNAQSIQGETSATAAKESANTWYGLYQKEKEYSEKNGLSNVVGSTMIWGSQYDQMLIWMQENGINVASSTPIGGASKNSGTGSAVGTTGTVETDKLNNIYDILGNSFEWTLEAYDTNYRNSRRRLLRQQQFAS